MDNNIISLFLQYREANGLLNITSDELNKCIEKRNKDSKELFDFINLKVHPKIRHKLINLIENYNNDYSNYSYAENTLYYKTGFSDGVKTILDVLYM